MDKKTKGSLETTETDGDEAPTVELNTKFGGPVRVVFQGLDQIYVETKKPDESVLTVNRVAYRVSFHLHDDGAGFEAQRDERGSTYGALTARRAHQIFGDEASGAARSKIIAELTTVVRRYLVDHLEVLIVAERVRLREAIRRVDDDLVELRKQVTEKQAERDALEARLAGLPGPDDRDVD
jgi:hypothetical protein